MAILAHWQLQQPTSKYAQVVALLTLLWIAFPLLLQLPMGVGIFFGVLFGIRLILTSLGIGGIPTWLNVVLLIAAGLAVYAQLQTLFGQQGGVALLLLMVVIKSFEGKSTRDWQVLLVASLFLVVGGLLFQQTLQTGMWLLCAVSMIFCSLCLLNGLSWREAWRNTLLSLGLSIPLMVVLFLTMPRFSEPLWRLPVQSPSAKTGLSTELTLGDMASVIESNDLAFNVTFEKTPLPELRQMYWRTMVMNDFDGNTWHANTGRTLAQETILENVAPAQVAYVMTLHDFQGHIPALQQVVSWDDSVFLRENQVVTAKRRYSQLRQVSMQSVLSDRIGERLSTYQIKRWTELPAQSNVKTLALAQNWKNQGLNDEQLIQKALRYYQEQGFQYSLKPGVLEQNRQQVDQFLFDSKVGFCEHYATSFVILMRAAGLPARVVTGYLGGSFNETGQFWQVRGKEAHAWAEVWLEQEQAWVRIDPTSSVSATRIDDGINAALPENMSQIEGNWPAPLQRWLATSQYYWQQWVVNYDADNQKALFSTLGSGVLAVVKGLLVWVLVLLLTLGPIIWWWRRQYRQQIDPLEAGFLLIKHHFMEDEHEDKWRIGALELEDWLKQHQLLTEQWQLLLQQYTHWRYDPSSQVSEDELWHWYAQVKKQLKHSR